MLKSRMGQNTEEVERVESTSGNLGSKDQKKSSNDSVEWMKQESTQKAILKITSIIFSVRIIF